MIDKKPESTEFIYRSRLNWLNHYLYLLFAFGNARVEYTAFWKT